MGHKDPRVPCSQCGRDIADYFSGVKIGMCNNCQKVYCKDCMHNFKHKECPICKQKMIETNRIQSWPPAWAPPGARPSSPAPMGVTMVPLQPMIVMQPQATPQKQCPKCKKLLNLDAKFCDGCGKKL